MENFKKNDLQDTLYSITLSFSSKITSLKSSAVNLVITTSELEIGELIKQSIVEVLEVEASIEQETVGFSGEEKVGIHFVSFVVYEDKYPVMNIWNISSYSQLPPFLYGLNVFWLFDNNRFIIIIKYVIIFILFCFLFSFFVNFLYCFLYKYFN